MTNQERNREALIQHVADLEAIIRRRNEQIAAQVEIIEGARRDLDDYQAMHSRQIETIARLQETAQKAEQERDRLRAEVVKAKLGTIRAIDDAIEAHENADAGISYLDQPTLTAITNLGEALDWLSRAWPGHFDIDLAVKSSGEQIAAWHQEDGVTEWYFGHKEQS